MRFLRFIGRLHLIWIMIVLLVSFFVFVQFVADTGGTQDAIPVPTHHSGTPIPTAN